AWLVVLAAATALAVAAVVLVSGSSPARRSVSAPSAQPLLLAGIPARGAGAGLFLGGENAWRPGRPPRPVAGLLSNGLSPLLPPGHAADVDQLASVPGGVIAHISDTSTDVTYGALGRVVFIPAANASARVIAWATMIAVSPDGQRVWVQTAVQSMANGYGVPASFKSPTWAVDLTGRRVSPVLHLPLGLAGATESGPLTLNLVTGRVQRWNGATGQPIPINLPADASFVAAGRDRVIWWSCRGSCLLHVTDLTAGTDAALPLPRHWQPPLRVYPPPPASFDPAGQRLVLPLDRVDSAGNITAQSLFIAADGMLRETPGRLRLPPATAATAGVVLAGTWDRRGVLWVLATNPGSGYYQLGFWAGTGPLRTFAPAPGSPVTLSAPGPG
ncbi:MAG TPA: hypothetical protein VG123_32370, partial [Streptosporangiaceae bacterium]|nr:hypothetical protein [Streptosporangiaceae bacterium]